MSKCLLPCISTQFNPPREPGAAVNLVSQLHAFQAHTALRFKPSGSSLQPMLICRPSLTVSALTSPYLIV